MNKSNIINLLIGIPLLSLGMHIFFGLNMTILDERFTINLDLFGGYELKYVFPLLETIILAIIYFINRKIRLIKRKEIIGSVVAIIYMTICFMYIDNHLSNEQVTSTILGIVYGSIFLLSGYGFLYKSKNFMLPHDILVSLIVVHYKKNYLYTKILIEFCISLVVLLLVKGSTLDIAFLLILLFVYYLNSLCANFMVSLKDMNTREHDRIDDALKDVKKGFMEN